MPTLRCKSFRLVCTVDHVFLIRRWSSKSYSGDYGRKYPHVSLTSLNVIISVTKIKQKITSMIITTTIKHKKTVLVSIANLFYRVRTTTHHRTCYDWCCSSRYDVCYNELPLRSMSINISCCNYSSSVPSWPMCTPPKGWWRWWIAMQWVVPRRLWPWWCGVMLPAGKLKRHSMNCRVWLDVGF